MITTTARVPPPSRPSPRELAPATEHRFTAPDGARLVYRAWRPAPGVSRALVLLHRGHEHSGRLDAFVRELAPDDVNVFAWDQRGHGRSPGRRGAARNVATLVRDLDAFVGHLRAHEGVALEDLVVLGHSIGAVIAAAWVHDHAPPIRGQILVAPAFRVKLYVPFARPALRAWRRLRRDARVKSYVRPSMLTDDRAAAAALAGDPLVSRDISVDLLLDLHDTATRLLDDAAAIDTPTLVLTAGSDCVVRTGPQRRFFERLSSPHKSMHVYRDLRHALLHEARRAEPIDAIRRFLADLDAAPPAPPARRRDDAERLARPLPITSPRRLRFAAARAVLGTVGRLSAGIRIGRRHGFDSGPSLDHVYRNESRGWGPLGRLVDRLYLDAIGWRGVRQRKAHLEATLRDAIGRVHAAGAPARILDVAAGPGRYLVNVLSTLRPERVSAVLRDRDPGGLSAGRALARAAGLANVVYEEGDAFDEEALAGLHPTPNVVVVSGLYELFPDNETVRRSLPGIARGIAAGGWLVYTNQPWHPQLEFIARVLRNREGRPWVMRCRPQAEMDGLVRAAGFEKVSTLVDDAGIFTVSLARRRPAP